MKVKGMMSNADRIIEIMNNVRPEWSELAKVVYICTNIAKIYNFKMMYQYGNSEKRRQIVLETKKLSFPLNGNMEEILRIKKKSFIEDKEKVCMSLVRLCIFLLRSLGIEAYETVPLEGDPHVDLLCFLNNRQIRINVIRLIPFVQTNSDFTKIPFFSGVSREEVLSAIEETNGDISFPGSDLHGAEVARHEEQSLLSQLDKVMLERGKYLKKVTGRNLEGITIERYYTYVLERLFPLIKFKIFPLYDDDFQNIEYVLIIRTYKEDYIYLFDKDENTFFRKPVDEIVKMKNERGMKFPKNDIMVKILGRSLGE